MSVQSTKFSLLTLSTVSLIQAVSIGICSMTPALAIENTVTAVAVSSNSPVVTVATEASSVSAANAAATTATSASITVTPTSISASSALTTPAAAPAANGPAIILSGAKTETTEPIKGGVASEVPPSFPIASTPVRFIEKVTGVTLLSELVAGFVATRAITHVLGGKVSVKIRTYSLNDLIGGKFKSVNVSVKDAKFSDVPICMVSAHSKNPFQFALRSTKAHRSGLVVPVMMAIDAKLTQAQMEEALKSNQVTQSLRGLRIELPGLGVQQLSIIDPLVAFADNQVKVKGVLVTKGATVETGVPISISANPILEGDRKIILKDLRVESPDIIEPVKFADFIAKLINPVIDFARLDRKDHAFRLKSMEVVQNELTGHGELLLAPRHRAVASK